MSKVYEVICEDEYNDINGMLVGNYEPLKKGDFAEYASTLSTCLDKEIEEGGGGNVVQIRWFHPQRGNHR